MKRMFTLNSKSRSRWMLLLLFLLAGVTDTLAQNVTISPTSGNLVAAVTDEGETGFKVGLSSLWRHEQLALSFTSSDRDALTESGELATPAAALGTYNGKLIISGGHRATYLVVSLPKGYRITGYTMVLVNDLINADLAPGKNLGNDGGFHTLNSNAGAMRFYEVKRWTTGSTEQGNAYYNNTTPTGSEVITQAMSGNDGEINGSTDAGKKYTISRFSQNEDDMGNQLYFRLTKDYFYYGLSIESFEIHFTAEGTFDAVVAPAMVDHAYSLVSAPFKTSKIDIGKLEEHTKDGASYFSYDFSKVEDLVAYNSLYQADAVSEGTPADVAENKHIYPMSVGGQLRYALGNDTYYVEPPVSIHTKSGLDAPIGYRIVGAKFDYTYGTPTTGPTVQVPSAVYITCTMRINGRNQTCYLNDQLHFVQVANNNRPLWQIDDEGNIYRTEGRYLSCYGEGDTRTLSWSTAATGNEARWNLRRGDNGRIYYLSDGGNYYYLQSTTNQNTTPSVSTTGTSYAGSSVQENHQIKYPDFVPGNYTLKIYDKTGENVLSDGTIEVTSGVTGSYTLSGLNNDAVKFAIEGLTEDDPNTEANESTLALVTVTLQLQALDPYINKMNIVCTDAAKELQMTQEFTASDFRVSGGKFIFYIPDEYEKSDLTFNFSDLYSNYGDNTYWGQSASLTNSRYSFVTSDYFLGKIDGNGNEGLYDTNYDPDADYKTKIVTSTAGNIRFKFNNAENLSNEGTGDADYLIETPFSVEAYLGSEDPDGDTSKTGEFIPCVLNADPEKDQSAGTFYVFTADETRYNIAPSKAWQHRAYAFYRMDIEIRAKTFTPTFAWEKIYDKACYDKDGTDGEDSMWGLTLGTSDVDINGEHIQGYLTYNQIINTIKNGREASDGVPAILKQLDPTNTNAPASMKQILYVDGTSLLSLISTTSGETTTDLNTLKGEIGTNALVYLPENTTSILDNVAYKTTSGAFMAGNNIVLTDKQPFFAPYEIQVNPANYATYSRQITVEENGMVQNATVMLPFTLALTSGEHKNVADVPGANSSFTVNTMATGQELQKLENSEDYYRAAYFTPFTESLTVANKPYMIRIDSYADEGNSIIFVASQKGSKIFATPESTTELEGEGSTGKYFTGESVNATFDKGSYTFTNKGSYSGLKFDRADSEQVFYFAANRYYDLRTLTSSKRYLYVYPFRAAYAYQTSASPAKMLRGLFVSYDEPLGGTTGINDATAEADLMVRPGKGTLTMTATRAQAVAIHTISGVNVNRVQLNAGETQVVNLPAGVYVVNNVKIVVK